MKASQRVVIPFAIGALAFSVSSQAADRDWVRYDDFVKRTYLEKFYALPTDRRDLLEAQLALKADKVAQIEITIPSRSGRITVRPRADGSTSFPVTEELLKENPMMLTNVPEGVKTKAVIELRPQLGLKDTYAGADLTRSVDQANRMIKAQAGLLSAVAPKTRGVVFHFLVGQAVAARIIAGTTTTVVNADAKGDLTVRIEDLPGSAETRVMVAPAPISMNFLF